MPIVDRGTSQSSPTVCPRPCQIYHSHAQRVRLTTESRLCLCVKDIRRRKWRRKIGIQELLRCRTRLFWSWRRLAFGGHKLQRFLRPLCHNEGVSLTCVCYTDNLAAHIVVRHYACTVGDNFILIDDNAKPST